MSYATKKEPSIRSENSEMAAGGIIYRCETYIQAVTMVDNLHAVTGKAYDIEADGRSGWRIRAAATDDHR